MTIAWSQRPDLDRPALIAAFDGWNDAARAASDALGWLMQRVPALEFAKVDPEEWYDFQAARPQVDVANGVLRSVAWPRTEFFSARLAGSRDLIFVRGAEPNLRWSQFCEEILDVATGLGCDLVITLGALLADTPHSRPALVTGTSDDPVLAAGLGLRRSQYQGPTGIVGALHDACRRRQIASVSLWAPVPHYIATPPSPKAQLALVDRVAALLSLPFDLRGLAHEASEWETRVGRAIADEDEISHYVEELERNYDIAETLSEGVDPWGSDWDDDGDDDDEDDDDDGMYLTEDEIDELAEWITEAESRATDALAASGWDDEPSGEDLASDIEEFLRGQGERDDRDEGGPSGDHPAGGPRS